MNPATSPYQAPCNRCLRATNHKVLHSECSEWTELFDEESGVHIWGEDRYTLLQCAGCDHVRMEHAHSFSEHTDDAGRAIEFREFYPPTVTRRRPLWWSEGLLGPRFQLELKELLEEVYQALAAGSLRLAAMGIRAVVERIMIDRCGDRGSFAADIKAFFAAGYVAVNEQTAFQETLIEAGHAVMHRGWHPATEDVHALLDTVERLIDAVYFQAGRATAIRERIPRRNPKS